MLTRVGAVPGLSLVCSLGITGKAKRAVPFRSSNPNVCSAAEQKGVLHLASPFMGKCVFCSIVKEFQDPKRACTCPAAGTGRFCGSWALGVSVEKGECRELGAGRAQPCVLSRSQ